MFEMTTSHLNTSVQDVLPMTVLLSACVQLLFGCAGTVSTLLKGTFCRYSLYRQNEVKYEHFYMTFFIV